MGFLVIIIIIAVFIFVGAILITILSFVFKTAHAVRRTAESQTVRAVVEIAKDLIENNDLQEDDKEEAKPRSVSDLTSVYIGEISKDFPELNVRELISSTENKLCLILASIGTLSEKRVRQNVQFPDAVYEMEIDSNAYTLHVTDDLIQQMKRRVDTLYKEQTVEHYDNIAIHHTGIHSYKKQGGTAVIVLQMAISYIHYLKRDGKLIVGSEERVEQARYDLQLIYIIDSEKLPFEDTNVLSAHCPNCGAAVKGVGDKFCEFCGAEVKTIDIRLWRVNAFSES